MICLSNDPIDCLHHKEYEASRRGRRRKLPSRPDPRRVLAHRVERMVAWRLDALGWKTIKQHHNAPFDLLATRGGVSIRIEVKASIWDGGRYQAQLRSNDADVLIIGCINEGISFLVIPFAVVKGQHVVTVRWEHPGEYAGKFSNWIEAWDVLDDTPGQFQIPMEGVLL